MILYTCVCYPFLPPFTSLIISAAYPEDLFPSNYLALSVRATRPHRFRNPRHNLIRRGEVPTLLPLDALRIIRRPRYGVLLQVAHNQLIKASLKDIIFETSTIYLVVHADGARRPTDDLNQIINEFEQRQIPISRFEIIPYLTKDTIAAKQVISDLLNIRRFQKDEVLASSICKQKHLPDYTAFENMLRQQCHQKPPYALLQGGNNDLVGARIHHLILDKLSKAPGNYIACENLENLVSAPTNGALGGTREVNSAFHSLLRGIAVHMFLLNRRAIPVNRRNAAKLLQDYKVKMLSWREHTALIIWGNKDGNNGWERLTWQGARTLHWLSQCQDLEDVRRIQKAIRRRGTALFLLPALVISLAWFWGNTNNLLITPPYLKASVDILAVTLIPYILLRFMLAYSRDSFHKHAVKVSLSDLWRAYPTHKWQDRIRLRLNAIVSLLSQQIKRTLRWAWPLLAFGLSGLLIATQGATIQPNSALVMLITISAVIWLIWQFFPLPAVLGRTMFFAEMILLLPLAATLVPYPKWSIFWFRETRVLLETFSGFIQYILYVVIPYLLIQLGI